MAGRTRNGSTGGGTGGGGSGGQTGGGGQGGGTPDVDRCALHFTTPLQGPDPAVVAGLTEGTELDVEVQAGSPYPRVVCKVPGTGQIAGSLAAAQELADLIACWADGHRYRGTVIGPQSPPMIRVFRSRRPGG